MVKYVVKITRRPFGQRIAAAVVAHAITIIRYESTNDDNNYYDHYDTICLSERMRVVLCMYHACVCLKYIFRRCYINYRLNLTARRQALITRHLSVFLYELLFKLMTDVLGTIKYPLILNTNMYVCVYYYIVFRTVI